MANIGEPLLDHGIRMMKMTTDTTSQKLAAAKAKPDLDRVVTDASYSISVQTLSRFSASHCDVFVNHVARTMFKDFPPSIQGQKSINYHLNNLPCFTTMDAELDNEAYGEAGEDDDGDYEDEGVVRGNGLTFGWSDSHLIRIRGVHEAGYESVALMALLAETFHEVYAARVLHYFALRYINSQQDTSAEPLTKPGSRRRGRRSNRIGKHDVVPHVPAWRAALQSSHGIFAASGFGEVLEDCLRLDPYSVVPGGRSDRDSCVVDPRTVAAALMALAPVVKGQKGHVTYLGGPALAWFAAVAEWAYSLKVTFLDLTGETLNQCGTGQQLHDAQVLVIYREKPDIEVIDGDPASDEWKSALAELRSSSSSWDPTATSTGDAKVVTSMPRETTSVDTVFPENVYLLPFGGRVSYNSLLPRTFGRSYWRLEHQEASAFAIVIGAAARAFEALVMRDEANDHVSAENRANPASYGIGLIQTITDWLPELKRGRGRMERQLRLEYDQAVLEYAGSLQKLATSCGCTICAVNGSPSEQKNGNAGMPSGNAVGEPAPATPSASCATPTLVEPRTANSSIDGEAVYCLPVLVETIMSLGLTLSRLTVTEGIHPTRQGLQSVYKIQVRRHMEAKKLEAGDMRRFALVYGNEWNASLAHRLRSVMGIFAGTRPDARSTFDDDDITAPSSHDDGAVTPTPVNPADDATSSAGRSRNVRAGGSCTKPGLVALSHEGICAYLLDLHRRRQPTSTGKPGGTGKRAVSNIIRITSGAICVRQKVYSRMSLTDPRELRERQQQKRHGNNDDAEKDDLWMWEDINVDYLGGTVWLR